MSAPVPPPPAESASRLSDFPSFLSPMLVKELRQGMRTNLFVIAFILLQTFMILCLLAGLANPGSSEANGFFWFFIITILLVIQPLRGFNALSSEYQLNTMDLIQLTKLNGWRITLGKWTALNAQGLLFLTGVLPYVVIRYFLGNVDFLTDLAGLGAVALGSALGTAITIGCSVFRHIVLRGVILAGFAFVFLGVSNFITFFVFGRYGTGPNYAAGWLFAITALYGIFFFLSFGASRIAPLSENHATRKRLLALLFAGLCQLFHLFGLSGEVLMATMVILALACVDALTEPLPIFSRVLEPFSRRAGSRAVAPFLAPGWMSGLAFTILCSLLFLGAVALQHGVSGETIFTERKDVVVYLSYVNTLLFPLLLIHLFFPRHGSEQFTFGLYLFIQGGLFVTTLMAMMIAKALSKWEETVYLVLPLPSVFLAASNSVSMNSPLYLGIALAILILSLGLPLIRNRPSLRQFRTALRGPSQTKLAPPSIL